MKLRTRQTLISMCIILLVMSAFLYTYVGRETNRLLDGARSAGAWQLSAFAEHVAAVEHAAAPDAVADRVTRQSLVQFTFSSYAHLMQGADRAFSLAAGGRYLYNLSRLDPMRRLPMGENAVSGSRMLREEGQLMLISGLRLRVLELPVTLYLTQDVSTVEEQIRGLTRTAQAALLGSLLVCALLLPLLIRRSLAPLEQLSAVADRIAGGGYALRSGIVTQDEVGALSRSFDRMADTVEEKIRSLEETNRGQQLLIGALTHELKTPMTAIIGFSDSLLTMPLDQERRSEALQQIHEAALRTERLSQKMMQLIALAHEDRLDKRPMQVETLLEKAAAATQERARQAGVRVEVKGTAGTLSGDADLLHSALVNLLDNAVKASAPGRAILLGVAREGRFLALTVTDQGRGIPGEEIPRLAQPFYRVDKARSRRQGGAGLGLALCRMIADAHGGQLRIQSELGKGTAVSLLLPREENDAQI